jgi:GH25 family lysozyme M1 (1,4-beta-N-acetylmuramidase)
MFIGLDTASVAGNKTADWSKAKASGISYGIVRAAYGTWEDTTFDRDFTAMKKAGVVRGAYLFLRFPRITSKKAKALPTVQMKLPVLQRPPLKMMGKLTATVPSPTAQAEAFCKIVGKLEPNDLPPSLDVEFPGNGASDTGMTARQLLDGVLEAWRVLKSYYGVAPIIYTSARVWLDDLRNLDVPKEVKESLLWLARYAFSEGPAVLNASQVSNPPVPPPWAGTDPKVIYYRQTPYTNDNWCIHQYQGNATGAPGFPTGDVDMNRMRPMQKGASGEKVKWVQRRLGFTGTNVDGKWGPMTDTAVRKVQANRSDTVPDGIIGPRTYAYLSWMNP